MINDVELKTFLDEKVVAYNTLDAESSHSVLREAIKNHGKPQIVNSD